MTHLTIIQRDGDYTVHKTGCKDIAKERAARTEIYSFEVATVSDLGAELWGDIASDYAVPLSDEWKKEIQSYMIHNTSVKPCVKF